jgi:hypothetical protein
MSRQGFRASMVVEYPYVTSPSSAPAQSLLISPPDRGSTSNTGQQDVSFNWTVTAPLNFVTYPVFYVRPYNSTDTTGFYINSHYFNIPPSASSTTTGSSSSTSSSPITPPTNTRTLAPNPGLSTGAKAGIGVGIPIFVILVAALIGGWRNKWRSRRLRIVAELAREPSVYIKPELAAVEAQRYELGGRCQGGARV